MTIKEITLWSFLTQSNAKREIVCPPGLDITLEEFADELKQQLRSNELPAATELCLVNWDDADTYQKLIVVRYTGQQASQNVTQFVVGLEQMGRFAYLEKRILLEPPLIPTGLPIEPNPTYSEPDMRVDRGDPKIGPALLVGIVASIGSYPLSSINEQALFLALGFALISFTYAGYKINVRNKKELARQAYNLQIAQKNEELKRQNYQTTVIAVKECQKKIYEQWLQDMLEATYMAKRNDVLGRWSSAVSTTIDQVVQKLFIDRQSQAQQWQEKQTSREELEKVLAQRSSEMFG